MHRHLWFVTENEKGEKRVDREIWREMGYYRKKDGRTFGCTELWFL